MNQAIERTIDIYGVVTNGEGWKFYRLDKKGEVHETLLYGIAEMSSLLGIVRAFFGECEQMLDTAGAN